MDERALNPSDASGSGWIDVSLPISPQLPVWPGSPRVEMIRRLDLARGDPVNDTTLHLSVHTGSHIDAPLHVLAGGASADALPVDGLIGPAYVAAAIPDEAITAAVLDRLPVPPMTERLLLKTKNSSAWATAEEFRQDYVALTADAARWVVDHGVRLIGVDYLSVQRFGDGPQTHLVLLRAGVVIVEGLNLAGVEAGMYDFVCLPLRLRGAEGAPARVVLRRR